MDCFDVLKPGQRFVVPLGSGPAKVVCASCAGWYDRPVPVEGPPPVLPAAPANRSPQGLDYRPCYTTTKDYIDAVLTANSFAARRPQRPIYVPPPQRPIYVPLPPIYLPELLDQYRPQSVNRRRSGLAASGVAIAVIALSSLAFVVVKEAIDKSHPRRVDLPTTHTPGPRPTRDRATRTPKVTSIPSPGTRSVPPAGFSNSRRLEEEIFESAASKSADPELGREYRQINERYFGNALPTIRVIWEPRLAEVGRMIGNNGTLNGITDGRLILLNSTIRRKRDKTTATLCHEMVHVYLITAGQKDEEHGAVFQHELLRLSEQGAFKGLWAPPAERRALGSWLDGEAVRLKEEASVLADLRKDLEPQQSLDDMTDLSGRIADFNERVDRKNADARRFSIERGRYELMLAYPLGLDEESVVPRRQVLSSARVH